jgi:peptidoglycan/LPS O-acetylase OafA/YrhL
MGVPSTIAFVRIDSSVLTRFGSISYSLYLTHLLVGGHVVEATAALTGSFAGRRAGVVCAMAASVAAAWVMYRLVERPAGRWSPAIRYRRRERGSVS